MSARIFNRPNLIMGGILVGVVVAGTVGVIVSTRARIASNTNAIDKYDTVQLPLEALEVTGSSVSFGSRRVIINGGMQLNKGAVISPSAQPLQPEAGQIYYDQTTNQLAYFNGTQFVAMASSSTATLQPSTTTTIVQNIQNIGSTGGVLSIVSANSSISVSDDGNGNITLTGSGSNGFLQGGNSFGATGVLGTNDNFGLNFETNGTVVAGLSNTGAATFINSTNSVSAFRVQNSTASAILDVDSLNQRIGVNTATPSALVEIKQNNLAPGTVTNLAASATVTGTGTTFLSSFQPGDVFTVTSTSDVCTVQQVTSDTALVCTGNLVSAATDSAYSFTQRARLAVSNSGVTTAGGPLMVSNPTGSLFSFQNDPSDRTLKISSNIIGNPSKDGGQDRNTAYIQASKFNSGTGGTLDSLYVYFTIVDNANPNFKVAIYDDLASAPNNRVSSATAPATPATVNVWNKASLGGTVTLAPNTDYWLAFTTESGNTWYARQNTGSNTTKYMGGFPWGTDFPNTYNVTDVNDVFTAVYGNYISTTDNSALAATGIHMTDNNELVFRPVFDSSTTLQVTNRLANRLLLGVNSIDNYVSAFSLQIGGVDLDSALFVRSGSPNGPISAWRDSSTNADSIMRLMSNVGGAGTLKFNFRSDGSIVMAGGQTADITTNDASAATSLALQPGATTGADGTGAVLSLKAGDETSNSCVTACAGGNVTIQGGSATGSSGTRNGGSVSIEAGTGATANGSIDIGAASISHAINLGTGAAAKTIIIGNSTGTTSLTLDSGTGGTSLTSAGSITIGTVDSTGTLFVLDIKDTSGDPAYTDGAMYYNSATRSFRCGQGSIWVSCAGGLLSSNTAPSSAVASTATETNFDLNYSLPANYCVLGRVIRWTAQGVYSTTGAPTLILRLKAGSTTLATSPTFTAGTGVSDQTWRIEGQTICNAAPGASVATETQGVVDLFTSATAMTPGELKNTSTTNLATNSALSLQISAEWGTASASNTITLRQFLIEGLGP